MKSKLGLSRWQINVAVLSLITIIWLFLVANVAQSFAFPFVSSDEIIYKSRAHLVYYDFDIFKLVTNGAPVVPGLYSLLFALPGYEDILFKIVNLIIFLIPAVLIVTILSLNNLSLLHLAIISVTSILIPDSLYAFFFLTETPLLMFAFTLLALLWARAKNERNTNQTDTLFSIGISLALALTILTKASGYLVLASFIGSSLVSSYTSNTQSHSLWRRIKISDVKVLALVVAILLLKAVTASLSTVEGHALGHEVYHGIMKGMLSPSLYLSEFATLLKLSAGHSLFLFSLFAFPLFKFGQAVYEYRNSKYSHILFFIAIALLAHIAFSICFTVAVGSLGPMEQDRLHTRYYFHFLIPAVLAGLFLFPSLKPSRKLKVVFLACSCITLLAIIGRFFPYAFRARSFADNPTLLPFMSPDPANLSINFVADLGWLLISWVVIQTVLYTISVRPKTLLVPGLLSACLFAFINQQNWDLLRRFDAISREAIGDCVDLVIEERQRLKVDRIDVIASSGHHGLPWSSRFRLLSGGNYKVGILSPLDDLEAYQGRRMLLDFAQSSPNNGFTALHSLPNCKIWAN